MRNHLATKQLIEFIGTDLFVYHGFAEFYLEGKWIKATPAFNAELCHRHKVLPLEFSGREDSIFQQYSLEGKRFMEYVAFHATYYDIPVDTIVAAWKETYGRHRVQKWIEDLEKAKGKPIADFYSEDIWDGASDTTQ